MHLIKFIQAIYFYCNRLNFVVIVQIVLILFLEFWNSVIIYKHNIMLIRDFMNKTHSLHILREGNSVADSLAKLGSSDQDNSWIAFDDCPSSSRIHLIADAVGTRYLRLRQFASFLFFLFLLSLYFRSIKKLQT